MASAEVRNRGRNKSTSFLAGDQIHKGAALGNKIKTKIQSNYPTLRQRMAEGSGTRYTEIVVIRPASHVWPNAGQTWGTDHFW